MGRGGRKLPVDALQISSLQKHKHFSTLLSHQSALFKISLPMTGYNPSNLSSSLCLIKSPSRYLIFSIKLLKPDLTYRSKFYTVVSFKGFVIEAFFFITVNLL